MKALSLLQACRMLTSQQLVAASSADLPRCLPTCSQMMCTQAAAMAGAHTQPLLWLRLAQACLSSVWKARGAWQAASSPDSGSEAQAQAQQLMFAGCCLQNARMLSDQPPPERPGAAGEQLPAPAAQWCGPRALGLWCMLCSDLQLHVSKCRQCLSPPAWDPRQVGSTPTLLLQANIIILICSDTWPSSAGAHEACSP